MTFLETIEHDDCNSIKIKKNILIGMRNEKIIAGFFPTNNRKYAIFLEFATVIKKCNFI